MAATGNAKRRDGARQVDGEARRRLVIEAAMLAFLISLALAFVASAPS